MTKSVSKDKASNEQQDVIPASRRCDKKSILELMEGLIDLARHRGEKEKEKGRLWKEERNRGISSGR